MSEKSPATPHNINLDVLSVLRSLLRRRPNVYIISNPNSGKPYLTDTLRKIWNTSCKVADGYIELYQTTRHSVASMAAINGVSIAVIREVLGHANTRTTQKYSHVDVLPQS